MIAGLDLATFPAWNVDDPVKARRKR